MAKLLIFNFILIAIIALGLWAVKKFVRSQRSQDLLLGAAAIFTILFHYSTFGFKLLTGGDADVVVSDESVEIILKDSGPGIANIEQAMQEGFSTAPDNVRSLGFGAGMGLPNMKRYTDYMHIDSVVGEGTTITMRVDF